MPLSEPIVDCRTADDDIPNYKPQLDKAADKAKEAREKQQAEEHDCETEGSTTMILDQVSMMLNVGKKMVGIPDHNNAETTEEQEEEDKEVAQDNKGISDHQVENFVRDQHRSKRETSNPK